ERFARITGNGKTQGLRVSFDDVVFLNAGIDSPAEQRQIRRIAGRLSGMQTAFKHVRAFANDLIFWQYVGLENGLHCSFPGKVAFPEGFDPRERPWYLLAKDAYKNRNDPESKWNNGIVWTLPVIDAATQRAMVTVATWIEDEEGNFVGATGIDLTLDEVVEIAVVHKEDWSADARIMLVGLLDKETKDALFVSNGDDSDHEDGLAIYIAQNMELHPRKWDAPVELHWYRSTDETKYQEMLSVIKAGNSGVLQMPDENGVDSLWAFAPVKSPNENSTEVVLLVVPITTILAEVEEVVHEVRGLTLSQVRATAAIIVTVLMLVIGAALVISRHITRPVAELASATKRIANGDLEARAPTDGPKELAETARVFNDMVPLLQNELKIRRDLDFAKEVQQALLPDGSVRFKHLDVAGRTVYCDETGGDYFDYLEDTHFGENNSPGCVMALGDVTGHGIAAALLMTSARALIRAGATHAQDIAQHIAQVNDFLCADLVEGRFMTLCCVQIDADTRTMRWVNAGHDRPIVIDGSTGEIKRLEGTDLVLGVQDGWEFTAHQTTLAPNSLVCVGSDGIWESKNHEGEMFGTDRFEQVVQDAAREGLEATAICDRVIEECARFRNGASQDDDITVIAARVP
ncbi:MAG: SpoIIE family protein phosphatase, partial [Planctomycetota bacterium]